MSAENNSRQALEEIFRLINAGQIQHAETRCRSYLGKHPDDINILALLGAVYLKQSRHDDARPVLEKAIQLEPAFAKPHEDLGTLYLQENEPKKAEACFLESIRLDGSQAGAFGGLAKALAQLGDSAGAERANKKFLALSPVARALKKASQLMAAGKLAEAEKVCDEASKQNPLNTDILRMLARIATEDGRPLIAEGLLKRIVKVSDTDHQSHVDLGLFLGQQGRYAEAVESLRAALERKPDLSSVQQRLGDNLAILGKAADALDVYDAALQLDRNFVPALTGRGHMLRILGRSDEAIRSYESATAIKPQYGDAWWGLSGLSDYSFSPAQISELQHQVQRDIENPDAKVCLYFALARACEDAGDYDAAWDHYVLGNTLKRGNVDYDPVRTELSNDSIIEVFNEDFLTLDRDKVPQSATPIFIVGMPRSGSTLLEQILASHSQVEGTSELPYMGMLSEALGGPHAGGQQYPAVMLNISDDQLAAFGKSYLYYSKDARPLNRPYFTDKMPANFQHVGLIHLAIPNAKIIDARRGPMDTCVGNFRQLFAKGKNFSYDLNECAEYYLEYLRVMAHWNSVLPGRVLKVQYEDVVTDVEAQARRLLEFCELPWEDACLQFYKTDRPVNTASSEQVRTPIYSGAVGFWKNHQKHLDDLNEILAEA